MLATDAGGSERDRAVPGHAAVGRATASHRAGAPRPAAPVWSSSRQMKIGIAVALATLVLLAAIGLVVVPRFGGERWAEMAAWAEKAQQEWTQRDFRRAPAWGEARAGAAAAAYDDALQQAGVLGRADRDLLRELRLRPDAVAAAAGDGFGH